MKKFALLTTTICALAVVPLAAQAAGSYHTKDKTSTYNMENDRDQADFKVRVKDNYDAEIKRGERTFSLADPEGKIHVNDDVIYYIEPDGNQYYAPDGPYTTTSGLTFYSTDGVIQYVLGPDQVVYVDTDYRDTNRDGVVDDFDVDVKTRKAKN